MSTINSYPKIYTLGHPLIKEIQAIKDKLTPGWIYRGEYLQKPTHNTIPYKRVPEKHFILFDVMISEETYIPYEEKVKVAAALGLEIVPVIYRGTIQDVASFKQLIDRESILGGSKIEGVVVKNYAKFGNDKKILCGKYVSEEFKEVHQAKWSSSNPTTSDVVELLSEQYRNEARWKKAVQHLRDAGKLTGTPQDIGAIIGEIQSDVESECAEEIKLALFTHAIPKIKRAASRGAPEWYKEELLKEQFAK